MSHHKFIGDWHVRIWQYDEARTATTWPLPVGPFWDKLVERIVTGSYHGVELSAEECIALRGLIHAYSQLVTQPKWRLRALERAMQERKDTESEVRP